MLLCCSMHFFQSREDTKLQMRSYFFGSSVYGPEIRRDEPKPVRLSRFSASLLLVLKRRCACWSTRTGSTAVYWHYLRKIMWLKFRVLIRNVKLKHFKHIFLRVRRQSSSGFSESTGLLPLRLYDAAGTPLFLMTKNRRDSDGDRRWKPQTGLQGEELQTRLTFLAQTLIMML